MTRNRRSETPRYRKTRLGVTLACCAAALGSVSLCSQAAEWTTIAPATAEPSGQNSLQTAPLQTAPADGETLHVVISLALPKRQQLASLVAEQRRAGSPAYQQYLDTASFNAAYAPSQTQAEQVAAYLRQQGFVNIEIAPNRMLVSADGAVGVAEQAFNTRLAHRAMDGRTVMINTQAIQLPRALAGEVSAVLGLQGLHRYHTLLQAADRVVEAGAPDDGLATQATQATQAAHGFAPTAFPAAYGVADTPDARYTQVGIITAGDMRQTLTDLDTFQRYYGLPTIATDVVQVGAASSDDSGTGEWDLDSQNIQAMAGGRVGQMIFYATTSLTNADITAAYNAAVSDGRAKIINVSLGECETFARQDRSMDADDQIFMAANAQGMMFSVSSGDSGSHECDVSTPTRNNARQSYPASSPYVVAVGGTSLYTSSDGSYADESAWIDGGGGPSTIEPKPSYQNGVVPGTTRGVPDIALDADPNTGSIIIVNGRRAQYGGTSLASPLFVGLYARIESATGNSHDFPLPAFYADIPANGSLVHDVTRGNNGGRNPYTATRGWDYTTGFGSPRVNNLYRYVASHPAF